MNYGKLTEKYYSVNIMNRLIDEIFNVIKKPDIILVGIVLKSIKNYFMKKLVPDTFIIISHPLYKTYLENRKQKLIH